MPKRGGWIAGCDSNSVGVEGKLPPSVSTNRRVESTSFYRRMCILSGGVFGLGTARKAADLSLLWRQPSG